LSTNSEAPRGPKRGIVRVFTAAGPSVRSFRWSVRQLRDVRRRLQTEGTRTRIQVPDHLGPRGRWGVRAALLVTRPTCLERSLLVQAWLGVHTTAPDVVIGVRKRSGKIEAHAWLDGRDPLFDPSYEELTRLSP
jgi:hypothetical protein